jgi:hypothetical protein
MTGLATFGLVAVAATKPTVAQKRSAEANTVVHTPRANGQCPVSLLAGGLSFAKDRYAP